MEQVAKATCILCKKLQRTRGGTWRFPRVSRAKSGILWLSGGTTRVKWRGASYLGPSMTGEHGTRRGIGARGVGELSQVQQHRLGSEADDGDGGDVGETVARVATVTMKVA